jgi:hypothetical protein
VGVTPAWEIEAWWLVFPDAVVAVVDGWREPKDWLGKDVGKLENAKEALAKSVRPTGGRRKPRDYHEADSIEIANIVVKLNLLPSFEGDHRTTPGKGVATTRTRSLSFGAFRRKLLALPSVEGGQLTKKAKADVSESDTEADTS